MVYDDGGDGRCDSDSDDDDDDVDGDDDDGDDDVDVMVMTHTDYSCSPNSKTITTIVSLFADTVRLSKVYNMINTTRRGVVVVLFWRLKQADSCI